MELTKVQFLSEITSFLPLKFEHINHLFPVQRSLGTFYDSAEPANPGFRFFAKIMKGSCVLCCSSCVSFNPTSHLKDKKVESPQFKVTRKTLFNTNKKVIVAGDSIITFLRSDELSTSELLVTVLKHPACSMEDMIHYIKPIARNMYYLTDTILLHVGTNDLAKGINTMNNIRKYMKAICEMDNPKISR